MKSSGVMEDMHATSVVVPMSKWVGANVTVFGMGRSGQAAADLLLDQGANVIIIEAQPLETLSRRE